MRRKHTEHRNTETQKSKKLCVSVSLYPLKFLGLLIVLFFSMLSCEDAYDDFPRTEVRFTCSLEDSPYCLITSPGQFLTVTKNGSSFDVEFPGQQKITRGKFGYFFGFGGLILGYPAINMDVSSQYVAYDRACPVEAKELVISRLNINLNREAECPKCGTIYDLDTGFPKQGEGKKRLKTYTVYVSTTNTGKSLVVRN